MADAQHGVELFPVLALLAAAAPCWMSMPLMTRRRGVITGTYDSAIVRSRSQSTATMIDRKMGGDMAYSIHINGQAREVDVEGDTPMLWVLRDVCGMTGTKYGCGVALCGACTIHVDGKARRACFTPVGTVGSAQIRTIETLHESPVGQALQKAFARS